jgi:hypothetical protein
MQRVGSPSFRTVWVSSQDWMGWVSMPLKMEMRGVVGGAGIGGARRELPLEVASPLILMEVARRLYAMRG